MELELGLSQYIFVLSGLWKYIEKIFWKQSFDKSLLNHREQIAKTIGIQSKANFSIFMFDLKQCC